MLWLDISFEIYGNQAQLFRIRKRRNILELRA